MLKFLIGLVFMVVTAPVILPDETAAVKEAVEFAREQRSTSARSTRNSRIKGYRTQEDARRHRACVRHGETIYFPNGLRITVEAGLKDVQIDGWWYAWSAK